MWRKGEVKKKKKLPSLLTISLYHKVLERRTKIRKENHFQDQITISDYGHIVSAEKNDSETHTHTHSFFSNTPDVV